MRGDFYKQLTNDLKPPGRKDCLKKSALLRLRSRRISPWRMEATLLTFAPITISGWRITLS